MGGQAFKDTTRAILKSEISLTLQWLGDQLASQGFTADYIAANLLGSGGKRDVSGDLDINVDQNQFNLASVATELEKILGAENVKSRPGTNQIFTAVPIAGTHDRVQVDFMFGNRVWQEFSYWSSTTSAVKGLYRTELIKALVAHRSDYVRLEDGIMVARVGPTFFHDRGLVWRYRHRPLKRGGGRVKDLREVTREEFIQLYPDAQSASKTRMIDPQAVMELILPQASFQAHDSFESLWQAVCDHYEGDDRALIRDIYLERLNSLKVEIVPEVKHALERDH